MVQICMIYVVEHVLVCLTGLSIFRFIIEKNNNDLEIYQINGTYVYHLIFDSNVRTICLIVLELKTIKKFD